MGSMAVSAKCWAQDHQALGKTDCPGSVDLNTAVQFPNYSVEELPSGYADNHRAPVSVCSPPGSLCGDPTWTRNSKASKRNLRNRQSVRVNSSVVGTGNDLTWRTFE